MSQPYCCPVCMGNGLVPNGFYNKTGNTWTSTSASPETCRSCQGTGVVWNNNESELKTFLFDSGRPLIKSE
jgi:DnaJ-class molecular chaperone